MPVAHERVPRAAPADAGFNQEAADAVYKAMAAMDEDTALVYGRFLVAGAVHYDLLAHREELAKIAQERVGERARRLREHYTRQAVAKTRAGQDASHEIGCLVQIGKAFGFTTSDRQRFAAGRTRGEGGRFVQEHHRIDTDDSKSPITDQKYAEGLGVPQAAGLRGEDLAHYQQAYGQIQDLLSPFHGKDQNALLHLNITGNGGTSSRTAHLGVPEHGKPLPGIASTLRPGERIESAAVSVNPKPDIPSSAVFDVLAAAGAPRAGGYVAGQLDAGALNTKKLREHNKSREIPANENFSAGARAFGRLERGSALLQDGFGDVAPRKLQYALAVANHVGQYGPEAQKVIGPAADRAAYRYRGTERELDPYLERGFADVRAQGLRGERARNFIINGRDTSDGWDPGPVLRYFSRHLPNPELNELQRKSGVIPPSEGVIIDPQGKVAHQSVGYADDWYLPFNLRHLGALRGGEYIRTRTFGGPTTEDIYTGLVSGARSLTVVSHNGVFNLEFDRNLRGGRRFNDKAARMVARYGQLLDAVRSEQVSRGGISPSRTEELVAQARQLEPDEGSPAFRTRLRELQATERRNPQLSRQESDQAAMEWLGNEAGRVRTRDGREMSTDELISQIIDTQVKTRVLADQQAAAASGVTSPFSSNDFREQISAELDGNTTEERVGKVAALLGQSARFDRAMKKANDDNARRARALKLDGAGYDAALTALQEQFPYYLAKPKYTPWRDSMGTGAWTDRTRETAKDTGYVAPRFNRPEAAQAGYFNDRVGQNKVEASSTRYQNYRVNQGKLRPVPTGAERTEPATAATAATPAQAATGADAQRVANLALLDDLLAKKTFGPGAQIKGEEVEYLDIAQEAKHPNFPGGAIKQLYTTARPALEAMPAPDLQSLLESVVSAAERDKLFTVDKTKVYAFRNGGKAPAPTAPPVSLSEKINGVDDNHTFPGYAYDATRNPPVEVVENTYASEQAIQHLARRGELAETVDDPGFEAKLASLQSRLKATAAEHARLSSVGGRPNPSEAQQAGRDADALLRAAQLRRNWTAANTRAAAAPAAAPAAGSTTNTFINAGGMTPEELQRALGFGPPTTT